MKKLIIVLSLLFSMCIGATLEEHYKLYPKDADTLFMTALDAIGSDNRFQISEIQSANGYILFVQGSKFYLLTLTKRYQNQTEIKVLPQNSDFNQSEIVAKEIFNLIDNKLNNQPMGLVR